MQTTYHYNNHHIATITYDAETQRYIMVGYHPSWRPTYGDVTVSPRNRSLRTAERALNSHVRQCGLTRTDLTTMEEN